ncbi:keratin, type II cytoskeletal 8-like isoform X1 [Micropterus salmoides]|uniref:keratin, type II cytoskeletal 8-like isoform X1 n=1 Tax=Micropterus salmoides TaxID=27706 RepID=UPI0018EA675D|nr:keratin, type II cytoskeletal 8-like isoform X1 [Micropterus salmoides]
MSKPRDYSSQSYSPGNTGPVKSYPTNKIDPAGKSREKDDMVGLNDRFVRLIDKVKHLENENRKLETKLNILKEQEDYDGKINDIVKHVENELEQRIDNLLEDKEKLQAELLKNIEEVEDTKKRYEDELQKKADLENEFVVRKKEADEGNLKAVDLALELEDLIDKLDFLRVGYDEEIKELESHIQNETVILHDNSKRSLDIEDIIQAVKEQYAAMATRTREEAEQWNQRKMDAMVHSAEQREKDVRDVRREISDLVRQIQRLNGDLDALIRKEESLKNEISDIRTEGDNNMEKAREDIAQLEEALKRAKQDLAGQIREHQELMNLKLALDIEIATYRKLLEGEEQRMNHFMRNAEVHLPLKQHLPKKPRAPEPTVIPATTFIPADTVSPALALIPGDIFNPAVFPGSKKRLLIRVEVEEGRVVSESSHYTED